jgi:predicted DNA-binding protein
MKKINTKHYRITIRLDTKEYEKLKLNAKNADRPISAYIRESSLGKRLHEKPPEEFYKILWNLDKIGTNINQIAMKVNTYNYLDEKELKKAISDLESITGYLRSKYIGSG